jgi:hypothetical protein
VDAALINDPDAVAVREALMQEGVFPGLFLLGRPKA